MTPEGIVKSAVLDYLKKTGRFHMRMQSGKVKVMGACLAYRLQVISRGESC